MNYLAHGASHVASPYLLAGTAVPDWLSVVNRRVRVSGKVAAELLLDDDPVTRAVAAGVLQHLSDDRWFHQTRVFAETSLLLAVELRELLPGDAGFRPSFLGHILVEILIDATLIERDVSVADGYYRALGEVSPGQIQAVVNRMAKQPTDQLAIWIERFLQVRFLYDYLEDDKLLFRLEQVMSRVGLPPLGRQLLAWFPSARRLIADRCDSLLTPPSSSDPIPDPSIPRSTL